MTADTLLGVVMILFGMALCITSAIFVAMLLYIYYHGEEIVRMRSSSQEECTRKTRLLSRFHSVLDLEEEDCALFSSGKTALARYYFVVGSALGLFLILVGRAILSVSN